jgi:hypothetical protein
MPSGEMNEVAASAIEIIRVLISLSSNPTIAFSCAEQGHPGGEARVP